MTFSTGSVLLLRLRPLSYRFQVLRFWPFHWFCWGFVDESRLIWTFISTLCPEKPLCLQVILRSWCTCVTYQWFKWFFFERFRGFQLYSGFSAALILVVRDLTADRYFKLKSVLRSPFAGLFHWPARWSFRSSFRFTYLTATLCNRFSFSSVSLAMIFATFPRIFNAVRTWGRSTIWAFKSYPVALEISESFLGFLTRWRSCRSGGWLCWMLVRCQKL